MQRSCQLYGVSRQSVYQRRDRQAQQAKRAEQVLVEVRAERVLLPRLGTRKLLCMYYRDAVLESNQDARLHLAEMSLPNGILRVDQSQRPEAVALRLGHYALPNLTGTIRRTTRQVRNHEVRIIDNGTY